MKTFLLRCLSHRREILALVGSWVATVAAAQDFTLEPIGFTSGLGASTDGTFTASGTFTPTDGRVMNGGGFAITGEFRNVIPGDPLAAEELIVNGSFEDTAGTFVPDGNGLMSLVAGSASSGAIPGWTLTRPVPYIELGWVDNTNIYGAKTPFGRHSLDLTGYRDVYLTPVQYGGVMQTIPTVPGRTYRLSLALSSHGGGQKTVSVCAGSVGTILSFPAPPWITPEDQWETFGFPFTASSEATVITIQGLVASGYFLGLDNVSVQAEDSPPPGTENLVTNGSFERVPCPESYRLLADSSAGLVSLQPGSTSLPGWTVTTAALGWVFNFQLFGPGTPYGEFFLDLTGIHESQPYGGITQTLATVPGEHYRVSFSLGAYESSLWRGPMSVGVTAGAVSNSFTFTPTGEGSQWGAFTMDFTATTTATPLTFTGLASGGGQYLGLDNVSVESVVSGDLALQIMAPVGPGGQLQLNFVSVPGKKYAVQSIGDLFSDTWAILPGTEKTGTGEIIQIDLPNGVNLSQRFYRVRVE